MDSQTERSPSLGSPHRLVNRVECLAGTGASTCRGGTPGRYVAVLDGEQNGDMTYAGGQAAISGRVTSARQSASTGASAIEAPAAGIKRRYRTGYAGMGSRPPRSSGSENRGRRPGRFAFPVPATHARVENSRRRAVSIHARMEIAGAPVISIRRRIEITGVSVISIHRRMEITGAPVFFTRKRMETPRAPLVSIRRRIEIGSVPVISGRACMAVTGAQPSRSAHTRRPPRFCPPERRDHGWSAAVRCLSPVSKGGGFGPRRRRGTEPGDMEGGRHRIAVHRDGG